MPKTQPVQSVLHDWVHGLTFQMQALLMTAVRGPDACTKENAAKVLVRYLRGVVLKPAGNWEYSYLPDTVGLNNNHFMWGEYDKFDTFAKEFYDDHDAYPHHFIMHLIHCAGVIGYNHPMGFVASSWLAFYFNMCQSFHMRPETCEGMWNRLDDFGEGYKEPENK